MKKKKKRDLTYLNNIYEKNLYYLGLKLNKIHCVNFSFKQWRIIIGPWLMNFITKCFDSNENLKNFLKTKKKKFSIDYFDIRTNELIPLNYIDYIFNYSENFFLNQKLYQNIIDFNFKNKFIYLPKKIKNIDNQIKLNLKNYIFKRIISFFSFNYKKIFFELSYLSFYNKLRICWRLKSLPDYNLLNNNLTKKNIFKNIRNQSLDYKSADKFTNFLKLNILNFIPFSYLENFKEILFKTKKKYYKKVISTSSYFSNDFFKIWLAANLKKTKFYLTYHGGSLPNLNQNFSHDEKIANKIFTWHKPVNKKQIQMFNLILEQRNILRKKKFILLTLPVGFYYPHRFTHELQSSQFLEDFYMKSKLIKKIINDKKKIQIRCLNSTTWDLKKRITKLYGKDCFDNNLNFEESLKNTNIHICGYLSTPYSEAIQYNIPTIGFINKKDIHINKKFIFLLNELKSNNLLFDNPVQIHKFLKNKNYEIDAWWNSNKIQKIILSYKKNILGTISRNFSDWNKVLS